MSPEQRFDRSVCIAITVIGVIALTALIGVAQIKDKLLQAERATNSLHQPKETR